MASSLLGACLEASLANLAVNVATLVVILKAAQAGKELAAAYQERTRVQNGRNGKG